MEMKTFKSDFVLLVAASIWGLAFVAQRMGMDHVGPFTYNGFRFSLGGLSLLPFLLVARKKRKNRSRTLDYPGSKEILQGGLQLKLFCAVGPWISAFCAGRPMGM